MKDAAIAYLMVEFRDVMKLMGVIIILGIPAQNEERNQNWTTQFAPVTPGFIRKFKP